MYKFLDFIECNPNFYEFHLVIEDDNFIFSPKDAIDEMTHFGAEVNEISKIDPQQTFDGEPTYRIYGILRSADIFKVLIDLEDEDWEIPRSCDNNMVV